MLPQPPWMIMRGLMGWGFSEDIMDFVRGAGESDVKCYGIECT